MAKRKSVRHRSASTNGRRRSRRGSPNRQGLGELPFAREYANDYSDMLDEIATLTRRNVAATFSLGIAAGLFTAQLARQWTTGVRKR